jgi:hypothetical protein
MKNTLILLSCLTFFFFMDAKEPEQPDSENILSQIETDDDIIKHTWELIVKELGNPLTDDKKKVELIKQFISATPPRNEYNREAQTLLLESEGSDKRFKLYANKELYKYKTEWISLSFIGGNYGLGCNISFFTFRWKYFFWETMRFQTMMYWKAHSTSFLGKTIVGVPIFFGFADRHEIRIGTGFSGGVIRKKSFDSAIHIPVEILYVFHFNNFIAFQTGITADFPLPPLYSGENHKYIPLIGGFAGFRF